MTWYHFVMLAINLGSYSHMRTALPGGLIANAPKRFFQVWAA